MSWASKQCRWKALCRGSDSSAARLLEAAVAIINVVDRRGATHQLEAVEGWSVMEILRDHGVGMEGLCGGACDCASCHVVIDPEWLAQLPQARTEELNKLDELPVIESSSRLSCQLIWSHELDGLALVLPQEV
jgi:ferredoxin